jgi:hypothetical protein
VAQDRQCFLVPVDRLVEAAEHVEQVAQVVQHRADLAVVADLVVDRQGVLEVFLRRVGAAPAPVHATDVVDGHRLARPVGLLARDVQRMGVAA